MHGQVYDRVNGPCKKLSTLIPGCPQTDNYQGHVVRSEIYEQIVRTIRILLCAPKILAYLLLCCSWSCTNLNRNYLIRNLSILHQKKILSSKFWYLLLCVCAPFWSEKVNRNFRQKIKQDFNRKAFSSENYQKVNSRILNRFTALLKTCWHSDDLLFMHFLMKISARELPKKFLSPKSTIHLMYLNSAEKF